MSNEKPRWYNMEDESDLEKIDVEYPEHDRTSCSDEDLYNAGTVFLSHRCQRCEALYKLRAEAAFEQIIKLKAEIVCEERRFNDLLDSFHKLDKKHTKLKAKLKEIKCGSSQGK